MNLPKLILNETDYAEAIRLADLLIDEKSQTESIKGIKLEELLYSIKLYEDKISD